MPNETRHDVPSEHDRPLETVSLDIDQAVVDARTAINEGVLKYLNSRLQVFGEAGLFPSDLSDGLLVAVLKLLGPHGKFAMEEGRFWQLLEQYDPYAAPTLDENGQSRLIREVETVLAVAENETFEDGFHSVLSLELLRLVVRYGSVAVDHLGSHLPSTCKFIGRGGGLALLGRHEESGDPRGPPSPIGTRSGVGVAFHAGWSGNRAGGHVRSSRDSGAGGRRGERKSRTAEGQHERDPGRLEGALAMTLALRVIRQSRWEKTSDFDAVAETDIPADALADFAGTKENKLSVWLVDDDLQELNGLLAALAAVREKCDPLDYLLFPTGHFAALEIKVSTEPGATPDEHANGLHRDLIRLSAAKVLALTTRVWHDNRGPTRISKRRVTDFIADSVRSDRIPLDALPRPILDEVRRRLADRGNEPGAAK